MDELEMKLRRILGNGMYIRTKEKQYVISENAGTFTVKIRKEKEIYRFDNKEQVIEFLMGDVVID